MVATHDVENNVCAFGNKNLGEFTAIYVFNWGIERKDGSICCTEWERLEPRYDRIEKYLPAHE